MGSPGWSKDLRDDAGSLCLIRYAGDEPGLYNGFLAAGLIWGMWKERRDIKLFFLVCVVIAGIFGGITAKTSILFTQALPAVIALACVLIATRHDGKRRGGTRL